MPTQVFDVTATPVDLLTAQGTNGQALELLVGKTYQGRYEAKSELAILRMVEAPDGTILDASAVGLPVGVFEDVVIIPVAGMGIFVWAEGGAGRLIINDAGAS